MGGDFSVDALQGPGSERQASENRERRSQILEVKMNSRRLFWANLILADSFVEAQGNK